MVSELANEAWRSGNENHAQDMFGCYAGTAVDTGLVMDYLSSYIFPAPASLGGRTGAVSERRIVKNLVLGISLGGHAAWHVLMQNDRVDAAVVVIGCPDYVRLMSDRARLSKRSSWTEEKGGQGKGFLGSKDFSLGLVDAIGKVDPAGCVAAALGRRREGDGMQDELFQRAGKLSAEEVQRLRPNMQKWFGGKRLLNLSGGADKLVSYKMGEPFLNWLKSVTEHGGVFEDTGFRIEDVVFPGVGHEVSGLVHVAVLLPVLSLSHLRFPNPFLQLYTYKFQRLRIEQCPPEMVPHMIKFIQDTLDEKLESETTTSAAAEKRTAKLSRI
jgi:pimeloyl-ACP methyl ester carboxylesterase